MYRIGAGESSSGYGTVVGLTDSTRGAILNFYVREFHF